MLAKAANPRERQKQLLSELRNIPWKVCSPTRERLTIAERRQPYRDMAARICSAECGYRKTGSQFLAGCCCHLTVLDNSRDLRVFCSCQDQSDVSWWQRVFGHCQELALHPAPILPDPVLGPRLLADVPTLPVPIVEPVPAFLDDGCNGILRKLLKETW